MRYRVLKPFVWAGRLMRPGEVAEISEGNEKVPALTRSKFIRADDGSIRLSPVATSVSAPVLPTVEEVVAEIKVEASVASSPVAVYKERQSPRDIVERAKARAEHREVVNG